MKNARLDNDLGLCCYLSALRFVPTAWKVRIITP